ncbi:putative quinol monooxygenase [Noviherbaspirillum sp. Root189]|uniref:putative quinol monooxygenase n=1 Tax=Noviherbaspirillum sp. Root189 TaxID=1736487 RepID=UPI0007092744|nr:antibiotic biosynthesis monooxygenase [Noviherbaspirillum sp. Root189]KRB93576.1 antibiotic biosynthesis monooxygenase [Noviherbaspirillum sp. Root189]
MSEIYVVAILYAKEGREEALRSDLVTVTEKSAAEEGNLSFELFGDAIDGRRFALIERWRDAEAHATHHNQSAHIAHFHTHGEANVERREAVHFLKRIA